MSYQGVNYQGDVNRREAGANYRRVRSRLYQLLAVAHSGPLGQELAGVIRIAAATVFGDEPLPEVPTPSRAELYRQVYGLDGRLAGSAHPLPAKLTHLSWSARKAEAQRRAYEASYLAEALLPCLDGVLVRAKALAGASGYRGLLLLTRAVAQADAKHIYIDQLDLHHGARSYRDVRVRA